MSDSRGRASSGRLSSGPPFAGHPAKPPDRSVMLRKWQHGSGAILSRALLMALLLQCILQAADSVLDHAFCLVGLTVSLQLSVTGDLAGRFLDGALGLLGRTSDTILVHGDRGRDAHYWAPPAQNRTCGFPAYGSHLGCMTARLRSLAVCRTRSSASGTRSRFCARRVLCWLAFPSRSEERRLREVGIS